MNQDQLRCNEPMPQQWQRPIPNSNLETINGNIQQNLAANFNNMNLDDSKNDHFRTLQNAQAPINSQNMNNNQNTSGRNIQSKVLNGQFQAANSASNPNLLKQRMQHPTGNIHSTHGQYNFPNIPDTQSQMSNSSGNFTSGTYFSPETSGFDLMSSQNSSSLQTQPQHSANIQNQPPSKTSNPNMMNALKMTSQQSQYSSNLIQQQPIQHTHTNIQGNHLQDHQANISQIKPIMSTIPSPNMIAQQSFQSKQVSITGMQQQNEIPHSLRHTSLHTVSQYPQNLGLQSSQQPQQPPLQYPQNSNVQFQQQSSPHLPVSSSHFQQQPHFPHAQPSATSYQNPQGMQVPPLSYPQTQSGQYSQKNTSPYAQPGSQQYPQPPVPQLMQSNTSSFPSPSIPQRRLDPDQMPNPIQVMLENQRASSSPFVTNQAGLVPPLVTTKYVTHDQGNSSPRFIRSSLYSVPTTSDMLKQTAIPFTLILSPFAKVVEGEIRPPIVDFGDLGPVRCIRCKAYMSPNMQFIDGGRRFLCLLCKVATEVPAEYFQHLDHTGQRLDRYEHPELVLGTYEFVATKDYCRDNTPPNIPAFIFIIDVSYNNIKSGLVKLLCSEVQRIVKHFPVEEGQQKSSMKVGFITYNSTVHFYNIKSSLTVPQMMVVGDVQEMFMPLLDGFLGDPEECSEIIGALMEQIPNMFADTRETETILYPAIQAGLEALKAYNCSGKVLVFNSSFPISDTVGKLKNREERKLLGTDKEKTILSPQTNFYTNLGHECAQAGCSVDLFICNNSYNDIATIGQVSRLTGGDIYKYTYFQAAIDGERLINDIIRNVSREIAFDSVMRVRTSTGIRPTDFYGNFYMSNTTDMEIASIDCNKAIAIEIKHDDKLVEEENVYIQVALLYTSCGGQRRLRILNLALKATSQMGDVFKSCDLSATILFMAKQSMCKLLELTPKQVKDNVIHRSAQLLACYRKHCTSPTSAGQLILPEGMKLLPLYVSCLLKNDAFSGGSDMSCDDRSYVIEFVLAMDLPISVSYFYPRLIPLHDINVNDTDLPMPIRCTYDKMSEDGAYLLENGIHMFIWLGLALPYEFINQVFNVQCTQQVDTDKTSIPLLENPLSIRIRKIIDMIFKERTRYMRVTLLKQKDKMENVFRHFLVEDRGADGSASYTDFLCHMHKEIKELLS